MEYLRGLAEGRSTFVPVPAEGVELLAAVTGDDVLGMALSHVSLADEVLRPVVSQLLSGVALVRDLEAARRCATNHSAYTFVTIDGEVVRPGGVVTGGPLEGPAVGALQKKREIGELELEVARVEERYNELDHPSLRAAKASRAVRRCAARAGKAPATPKRFRSPATSETCTRQARASRSCASGLPDSKAELARCMTPRARSSLNWSRPAERRPMARPIATCARIASG